MSEQLSGHEADRTTELLTALEKSQDLIMARIDPKVADAMRQPDYPSSEKYEKRTPGEYDRVEVRTDLLDHTGTTIGNLFLTRRYYIDENGTPSFGERTVPNGTNAAVFEAYFSAQYSEAHSYHEIFGFKNDADVSLGSGTHKSTISDAERINLTAYSPDPLGHGVQPPDCLWKNLETDKGDGQGLSPDQIDAIIGMVNTVNMTLETAPEESYSVSPWNSY